MICGIAVQDVYKRQPLRLGPWTSTVCAVYRIRPHSSVPVSYTHLIQDYYTYELTVRGVSANPVIHRHANIRKALQHAFKLGLIDTNPADRMERPKKEKFVGSVYEEDELNRLFEIVKGAPIAVSYTHLDVYKRQIIFQESKIP